jgi:hypothetical protein
LPNKLNSFSDPFSVPETPSKPAKRPRTAKAAASSKNSDLLASKKKTPTSTQSTPNKPTPKKRTPRKASPKSINVVQEEEAAEEEDEVEIVEASEKSRGKEKGKEKEKTTPVQAVKAVQVVKEASDDEEDVKPSEFASNVVALSCLNSTKSSSNHSSFSCGPHPQRKRSACRATSVP